MTQDLERQLQVFLPADVLALRITFRGLVFHGYFAAHGIKMHVITLPNGMIGSIFLASLRVSDSGLLNMSNLNGYLVDIFHQNNISLPGNYYPCLYEMVCSLCCQQSYEDIVIILQMRLGSTHVCQVFVRV